MRARKVSKSKSAAKKKKGFFSDKKKVGLVFVGLFLIVLMVGSMLISGDEDNSSEYEYNGHYFVQIDGYWNMVAGDQSFTFIYDPLSLENVTMEDLDLQVEKVYVGFVPGEESMEFNAYQRTLNLMKAIVPTALPACFEEEGCPDLPIVSCEVHYKYHSQLFQTPVYSAQFESQFLLLKFLKV